MDETGRPLVHPFDDPMTIAGQGTVGLEIVEDLPESSVIVVPVGGGGLISGIALAAEGRRVVAAEPELSDALHRGLEAGKSVPVQPRSIADGLSAPFAGEHPVRICAGVAASRASSSPRTRSPTGCASSTAARSSPASRPQRSAWRRSWPGKSAVEPTDSVAVVVSGGNVAAEIASAILGSNEGRNPS